MVQRYMVFCVIDVGTYHATMHVGEFYNVFYAVYLQLRFKTLHGISYALGYYI